MQPCGTNPVKTGVGARLQTVPYKDIFLRCFGIEFNHYCIQPLFSAGLKRNKELFRAVNSQIARDHQQIPRDQYTTVTDVGKRLGKQVSYFVVIIIKPRGNLF